MKPLFGSSVSSRWIARDVLVVMVFCFVCVIRTTTSSTSSSPPTASRRQHHHNQTRTQTNHHLHDQYRNQYPRQRHFRRRRLCPFPKVMVINLPRHVERRQRVSHELEKRAGLPSRNIFFLSQEAVDGHALVQDNIDHYRSQVTPAGRWFMTPGMMGCFLSHRKCWERVVQTNQPWLILEDDVYFSDQSARDLVPTVRAVLTHFERQHNKDDKGNGKINSTNTNDDDMSWDMVLLGAMGCVHPNGGLRYGLNWIPSLVSGKWRRTRRVAMIETDGTDMVVSQMGRHTRRRNSEEGQRSTGLLSSTLIHVPLRPFGFHAYLLSPQGAAKLLAHCPRASYHVDVVALGCPELLLFAVHPLLAWQTNIDTTIGGRVATWRAWKLPTLVPDPYTGFELGWALSAPLLRIGGPRLLNGKVLLTNGNSLAFMLSGLVLAACLDSKVILGLTIAYTLTVTLIVRFLASAWNA